MYRELEVHACGEICYHESFLCCVWMYVAIGQRRVKQYSAMDQTLSEFSSTLSSLNSSAQVKLLGLMQTPPVPNLITTSNSQKLSNGTPFHELFSSNNNMPPL